MENIMFIGGYSTQINTSNQLSLPAHYSAPLMEGAFITQGFDHNLLVLKSSAFETLVYHIQGLNMADPLVRLLFRLIMSRAVPVQPNDTGKIEIPAHLAEFAGLQGETVVIGQGEYIEIWATETWKKQENNLNDSTANSYRFKDLKVS